MEMSILLNLYIYTNTVPSLERTVLFKKETYSEWKDKNVSWIFSFAILKLQTSV